MIGGIRMVNGTINKNGKNTREIRISRRHVLGTKNLPNLFDEEYIKNMGNTSKRTKRNINKLLTLKDAFESREIEPVEIKEKIQSKEKSLDRIKKELDENINYYLDAPLDVAYMANDLAKDYYEQINKEEMIEFLEGEIRLSSKIKMGIVNSTYNLSVNLIKTLKEYSEERNKIMCELKKRNKEAEGFEKISSTLVTLSLKSIQVALVSLGAVSIRAMESIDGLMANLNTSPRIFVLSTALLGMYELVDKTGKKLITRIYKWVNQKKYDKKEIKIKEEFVDRKRAILISLYNHTYDSICVYLQNTINKLGNSNVISEIEKKQYEEMLTQKKKNARIVIDNISKQL